MNLNSYWMGCIVMGSVYALFGDYHRDVLPFLLGQIFMGCIGLYQSHKGETNE